MIRDLEVKPSNVEFLDDRDWTTHRAFMFGPDKSISIEGKPYPGAMGIIHEFFLKLRICHNGSDEIVRIPIIVGDGMLAKAIFDARFVFGREARVPYAMCAATVVKLIRDNPFALHRELFAEAFADIRKVREHQILRAGAALTMAPFWPGLRTQGDDVKRHPVEGDQMFDGRVVGTIYWGPETTDIADEICIATGANFFSWGENRVENKPDGGFIFLNSATITIEGLVRTLPLFIAHGITPIIFCWGGIFNLYNKNLHLPGGDVVNRGTMIGMYPPPAGKVFISRESYAYDRGLYPVEIHPDIVGEAGEKISDGRDLDVIPYDLFEMTACGIDLSVEPWRARLFEALKKSPGSIQIIKNRTPEVYENLKRMGFVFPEPPTAPTDGAARREYRVEIL